MSKKALFIFPRPIFPIIGGDQIRAYQQLSFLMESYDVFLVYLSEEQQSDNCVLQYLPNLLGSKCFRQSRLTSFMKMGKTVFNRLPLQVNYYTNKRLANFVKEHYKEYDVVFSGNPRVAEHVVGLPIKKLLDFVDAASMNCLNAKSKAHGLKKIFYSIDYHLMKLYERKMLNVFDSCAIISEVDKKFLEQWIK